MPLSKEFFEGMTWSTDKAATELRSDRQAARRERIATAAMQGMLTYGRDWSERSDPDLVASLAVQQADALIAELDKDVGT